jgi:two-component system response regulator MprA
MARKERAVRVLVVDDDPGVRTALDRALRLAGYEVTTVVDGQAALDSLALAPPDAVVLDLGLPGIDGLEVCRRMRTAGDDTPVLMLTARDAVHDRVLGLDAGADDYVVKPFALAELEARLRALLRRRPAEGGESLRFSDLVLDLGTREARRADRPFTLTRIEFDLLELFLRHPRQVLTREIILDRVWGYSFDSGTNSLAVYVGYLRRKTEAGNEPRLLHTVRGVGYVLRDP